MANLKDTKHGQEPPSYEPCVTFSSEFPNEVKEKRIGPLIDERQSQRRLFYGLEVLPRTDGKPTCLDFNRFLPMLPLFVSVTWLGKASWNVEPVGQVESLQLAKHLSTRMPVMPHFTLYRLTEDRLDQFLDLNFSNVLALAGDQLHPSQPYRFSKIIVEKVKSRPNYSMSVCVGGFPEGYKRPKGVSPDLMQHLKYLKEKVDAGADCIITQVCYQHDTIIEYVKKVRALGITVPILIGIMTHQTFRNYTLMENLTSAKLTPHLREELVQLQTKPEADEHLTKTFFVRLNVQLIRNILEADLNIFGFQFFTLNNFKAVEELLKELHLQKLFSDRETELPNSNNFSIYLKNGK